MRIIIVEPNGVRSEFTVGKVVYKKGNMIELYSSRSDTVALAAMNFDEFVIQEDVEATAMDEQPKRHQQSWKSRNQQSD